MYLPTLPSSNVPVPVGVPYIDPDTGNPTAQPISEGTLGLWRDGTDLLGAFTPYSITESNGDTTVKIVIIFRDKKANESADLKFPLPGNHTYTFAYYDTGKATTYAQAKAASISIAEKNGNTVSATDPNTYELIELFEKK